MPAPAGKVFVAVKVAVREDVEARALFVANHDREGVLKLLAEADVHHAAVERLAPHAHVEPAGTRPGSSDGAGEDQVFRDRVRHRFRSVVLDVSMVNGAQKLTVTLAFLAAALSLGAASVQFARDGSLSTTPLLGGLLMLALGIGGFLKLKNSRE